MAIALMTDAEIDAVSGGDGGEGYITLNDGNRIHYTSYTVTRTSDGYYKYTYNLSSGGTWTVISKMPPIEQYTSK